MVVGFSYFAIFESIYDLTLFYNDYHPATSIIEEGNKNAFEALYRGYNARIYNFVLSMVSNAGVAKDITQDIFSPYLGEAA